MTAESVRAALACISPEDRSTWLRIGMALHSSGLPEARSLWMEWSRGGSSFRPDTASATWRSFRPGTVTMGTLWFLARQGGWSGKSGTVAPGQLDALRERQERAAKKAEAEREQRAASAAAEARRICRAAKLSTHPYLEAKGFPRIRWLCYGEDLVVPMSGPLGVAGYQCIKPDGAKRFLPPGCRAFGATYRLGRNTASVWLVEGLATGLSVRAALQRIGRGRDEIRICFSAGALKRIGKGLVRGFVVADNDASGTGAEAAEATRLPWWMPPEEGQDANDYHLDAGLPSLAFALQTFLRTPA